MVLFPTIPPDVFIKYHVSIHKIYRRLLILKSNSYDIILLIMGTGFQMRRFFVFHYYLGSNIR